jgi:probable F420-dependent oxidoreductase
MFPGGPHRVDGPGYPGPMRFGVYLPTYAWPDLTPEHTERLRAFARRAEALGFDALWAGEHFMVAGHYGVAWMSPLLCLAHAAAVTTRIRLATGVLVLPYHHPLPLAREIQTLHQLSGGRVVLGVGTGWDRDEFDTLGIPLAERGARTDEIVAALRRLLIEEDVTFQGRYYWFEHVTIAPALPRFPELWVGGGSKLVRASSPDKPYLAPTVLARIAGADGWLARGDAPVEMVTADLHAIRAYLTDKGRDPASIRYGHYPPGRRGRPRRGRPPAAPALRANDGLASPLRGRRAVLSFRHDGGDRPAHRRPRAGRVPGLRPHDARLRSGPARPLR